MKDSKCHDLVDQAVTHYKQETFETALLKFEQAYVLSAAPELTINIGRTLYRLGRYADAAEYFRSYLFSQPTAPEAAIAKVRSFLKEAEEALSRSIPVGGQLLSQTEIIGHQDPSRTASAREFMTRLTIPNSPPRRRAAPGPPAKQIAWRATLSTVLVSGGALLLGFGGFSLKLNGSCAQYYQAEWSQPHCEAQYDTGGKGWALIVGGLATVGLSILPWGWGIKRRGWQLTTEGGSHAHSGTVNHLTYAAGLQ